MFSITIRYDITIRYIFHSRIFIFLVLLLHSLLVEIAEIEIVRVIFMSEQCFVYTFLQVRISIGRHLDPL